MKKTFFGILVVNIIMIVCISSCASKEDKQQERQQKIKTYSESLLDNPMSLDKNKADTLILLYDNYIKDFPKDTMRELYLFQMSQVYANMQDCNSSLQCLDRIIKEYPNGKKVGAAYFFKGVYLKEICLNTEESVKAFQTYIDKFPNSKQVETAKRMLEMDTMQNPVNILKDNE